MLGVRQRDLDQGARLVRRRPEHLSDQHVGDLLRPRAVGDRDQIDGSHEAAGPNGRAEREHRGPGDLAPRFGDEDRGLWEEDQLAEEVPGIELTELAPCARGAEDVVAERDDAIDVRDARCPDQVLHRLGSILMRARPRSCHSPDRSGPARGTSVAEPGHRPIVPIHL